MPTKRRCYVIAEGVLPLNGGGGDAFEVYAMLSAAVSPVLFFFIVCGRRDFFESPYSVGCRRKCYLSPSAVLRIFSINNYLLFGLVLIMQGCLIFYAVHIYSI